MRSGVSRPGSCLRSDTPIRCSRLLRPRTRYAGQQHARTVQPGIAGVFAVTGNAALLGINCAGSAGGYSVTSNAATLQVLLSAAAGNYAVSGNPSAFTAEISCRPQAFTRFPETPRHSARRYRLPWAHSPSPALAQLYRDFEAWFPRPSIADNWSGQRRSEPSVGGAAPSSGHGPQSPEPGRTLVPAVIHPRTMDD